MVFGTYYLHPPLRFRYEVGWNSTELLPI